MGTSPKKSNVWKADFSGRVLDSSLLCQWLIIGNGHYKSKNLTLVGNWTNASLLAACRINGITCAVPMTTNKDRGKHFPEKREESRSQISRAVAHQRTLVCALHSCAGWCELNTVLSIVALWNRKWSQVFHREMLSNMLTLHFWTLEQSIGLCTILALVKRKIWFVIE